MSTYPVDIKSTTASGVAVHDAGGTAAPSGKPRLGAAGNESRGGKGCARGGGGDTACGVIGTSAGIGALGPV